MDRLTARTTKGHAYYPECFKEPCNGGGCTKNMCDFAVEVCDKLAAYEDTGISPEQIREIDRLYSEKCRELAEEKKKHRWIPVKNPPEENGGYICTLAGDMVGSEESFVGMSWYENGEWDDVEDVIAWMPLPEPYKENENERIG